MSDTIRNNPRRRNLLLGGTALAALAALGLAGPQLAQAQTTTPAAPPAPAGGRKQPNILVIFGDDIGLWNLSVWNKGMMGFKTPYIDRIANEGAIM